MASVITNLSIDRRQTSGDVKYCINFISDDISALTKIKDGEVGKRIWIDRIIVAALNNGTQWFKIYDGENVFIGPIVTQNGVPWVYSFVRGVNLTLNNDLQVRTQSAFQIHIIIEGIVDINPDTSVSASVSASISASPSS